MADRWGIIKEKKVSILASINQATKYFELAEQIFGNVKATAANTAEDISADTLEEAQARLKSAMERATAAHDGLEDAIAERLATGDGSDS